MLAIVAPAAAILVRVGDVEVQPLVAALKHAPVQLDGRPNPSLTGGQVRALRARIARRDPGRIAIAIVTPFSTKATGDLSEAISEQINRNGVVVVVSGYNYHVSTTWGSGTGAGDRLGAAVDRPGDSLYVQMQRTIDSFARADAKAGHPGANSSEQNGPAPSQGQVTTPTNTSNGAPGSSGSPSGSSSSSGGGSGGLIAALIGVAIVLLVAAVPVTRAVRRSMRSSHWRKEEALDVHAQAQADFIKLGEDIGALDIDSSMPNASAAAKGGVQQGDRLLPGRREATAETGRQLPVRARARRAEARPRTSPGRRAYVQRLRAAGHGRRARSQRLVPGEQRQDG